LRRLGELKDDAHIPDDFASSLRLRSVSESSSGFSSISTSPTYEGKLELDRLRSIAVNQRLMFCVSMASDEGGYMTSSTGSDLEDQSSVQSDCGVTIIMERLDVQPDCKSTSQCSSSSSELSELGSIDWRS
jgi:hypothetical protein